MAQANRAETSNFDSKVREKLRSYVYRLIDPRNGQTFYVGKGKGDRIFQHIKAAGDKKVLQKFTQNKDGDFEETEANLKIKTIREIHDAGLEVLHVIHRHGLTEDEALVVEAALIDAYPGLANIQNGKDSGDYGCRNVTEIIRLYSAKEVEFTDSDKLLLIKITDESIEIGGNIYEAVRKSWVLKPERANRAQYVLAVKEGIVVGIFTLNEKGWQRDGNSNRYFSKAAKSKAARLSNASKIAEFPTNIARKGRPILSAMSGCSQRTTNEHQEFHFRIRHYGNRFPRRLWRRQQFFRQRERHPRSGPQCNPSLSGPCGGMFSPSCGLAVGKAAPKILPAIFNLLKELNHGK